MMSALHLHHHQHTGKLLHHRHTSYRSLLLVMLSAGIAMLMISSAAKADDLFVTATVAAPIPSGAPAFTAPADGTVVSDPTIQFEGSCPISSPAVIIVIKDGASTLGSTPCQPDGTFSLQAQIAAGIRSIIATVMTITGDTGQSSAPLSIIYIPDTPTPPPVTPPSGGGGGQPTPNGSEFGALLDIVADRPFLVFGPQEPARWRGYITGGSPPYRLVIDWGDGSESRVQTIDNSDPLVFSHSYASGRSYEVTFKVTDLEGATIERTFAAVNLSPEVSSVATGTDTSGGGLFPRFDFMGGSLTYAIYAPYVLYAVVFMGLLWLWKFQIARHGIHRFKGPLHYPWQRH